VAKWLRRGSAKPLFGGPNPPVASNSPVYLLLPYIRFLKVGQSALLRFVPPLLKMFIFNYGNLIDPLFRDVRRFTPDFTGMKAGDKVIDVCCGTGAQVLEYGRCGIEAVGIDHDPNMIRVAVKNKNTNKLPNISFQLANAAVLPFTDGYFDYASITLALHDKEQPLQQKIVAEMKRVVKRGGSLVLIDYNVPLPRHIWAVSARVIEFAVGGSHYRAFQEYLAHDGTREILKKQGLREESRVYLKSGLLAAVKAVNA
jgi:ubiquinone/menaquinone biosynthesis C-methylase UbiE